MKESYGLIILLALSCCLSYFCMLENTFDRALLELHESYNIEGLIFKNIGSSTMELTGRNVMRQVIKLEENVDYEFKTNRFIVIAESVDDLIVISVYEKNS